MVTQFIPVEQLTMRRRWEFAHPLSVIPIEDQHRLLLHPESGSWAIVPRKDLSSIMFLRQAAERGLLDEMDVDENEPLLATLLESGLLLKDGKAVWSEASLNHSMNPTNTLILKLVGYCNLACSYCYDYNRVIYRHRMSQEVGESAIDQALDRASEGLKILFHGGEPLLEFDLMRRLVTFARQKAASAGREISFAVQTNGTQFTDAVVNFLLTEDFGVGVSLDGPPEINDALRIDHAGDGHQPQIEAALCNYPELASRVEILTTVTSRNVAALVDVARYVCQLGVPRWDITLFEASGRGADDPEQFKPDTNQLIRSYFELLDAVEQGEFDRFEVRPVLKYVRNVLSYRRQNMCLRDGCGAAADLVSIRVDGTIEACDCIKDPELELGSLANMGIDDALNTAAARAIRGRTTENLLPCRSCDWRVMCGGTCQAKASVTTIDDQQCRLAMALFPEIFRRLARSDRLLRYARLFS